MTTPAYWPSLQRSAPLRVRVRDALEDLVVNGVLRPGEHLAEEDLAARLGVSRNPIREGLQQLAHDGFVELRPGRGAFVHAPTMREIDEIFHVRTLLESDSARLAADRITPPSLERLEEILGLGEEAVREGEPLPLLELNARFHGIVVASADNSLMASMLTALSKRIRWYFASVVVLRAPSSWHQHDNIYQALLARDGEAAARLMAQHVGETRRLLQARHQPDGSSAVAGAAGDPPDAGATRAHRARTSRPHQPYPHVPEGLLCPRPDSP